MKQFILLVVLIQVCLLAGCANRPLQPKLPVGDDWKQVQEVQAEVQAIQSRQSQRHVWIDARDIELPLTTSDDTPTDTKLYNFYVWADSLDPSAKVQDLLHNELEVEVTGADATIEPVTYQNSSTDTNAGSTKSPNLLRIQFSSDTIGDSITIVAWFKDKYLEYETQRRQAIEDLLKQIEEPQLNSDDRDLLFSNLEDKLNQNNPWGEIRQIRVFNGDLHTRIYMASYDEIRSSFGETFANYFHVGRVYLRNKHADKKLIVHTTSLRARCLFYREPNKKVAKWFLPDDLDGTSQNNETKRKVLKQVARSLVSTGSGNQTQTGLSRDQVANLLMIARELVRETTVLKFVKNADRNKTSYVAVEATQTNYNDDQITKQFPNKFGLEGLTDAQKNEAVQIIKQAYVQFSDVYINHGKSLLEIANQQIANSRVSAAAPIPDPFPYPSPALINLKDAYKDALVGKKGLSAMTLRPADQLKFESMLNDLDEAIQRKTSQIFSQTMQPVTPMAVRYGVKTSPTEKSLASSPDLFLQSKLSSIGYMWSDYYRPMTFESVLISLLDLGKRDTKKVIMDWLETAGVFAGALVGLGSINDEFTRQGFSDAVALSTGVFIPELRKRLLDDLDSRLESLGTQSLGTVISIPPNEPVDGYVFFPKGPIFGTGVDEFNINVPSYIVDIDNVDVVVDGSLVDKDFEFSSGVQDPAELVGEAKTKGHRLRDERESELTALQGKLENYTLSTLQLDVRRLLRQSPPDTMGAMKLLNAYKDVYGDDDMTLILTKLETEIQNKSNVSDSIKIMKNDTTGTDITTLKLVGSGTPTVYAGKYQVRLSDNPNTQTAFMTLTSGASTPPIKLTATESAGATNQTDTTAAELLFKSADATAADNIHAWHEPFIIEVKIDDYEGIEDDHLYVEHRLSGADARFRSSKVLRLVIEK